MAPASYVYVTCCSTGGSFERGDIRWFADGQLNVSYNCIDRHIKAGQWHMWRSTVAMVGYGDTREVVHYCWDRSAIAFRLTDDYRHFSLVLVQAMARAWPSCLRATSRAT